jgi:hypothetical protein
MSTTNHPQTDGQSEHTNQQMEQGSAYSQANNPEIGQSGYPSYSTQRTPGSTAP